jgi:hypothetical protein
MLSKNPSYRRLKVGGIGMSGSASYWLGSDHLFLVVSQGYTERYHRVAFADIQGVVVRGTNVRGFWAAVLGLLLAASLIGILTIAAGQGLSAAATEVITSFVVLCVLALGFLVPLVWNWLLGPTCVCHLRTAVQTMPMPHLRRLQRAERLIAELSPLVVAAQAGLLAKTQAATPATAASIPAAEPGPAAAGVPVPPAAEPPGPEPTA